MKVETPQILWNSEGDKGINAALNSISVLESGWEGDPSNGKEENARRYGHVMVTAGNTNMINLWKLSFPSPPSGGNGGNGGILQKQATATTKIDYLCSLTRQEQSVNSVSFSPDGLHLATGGETGSVIVWSVPPNKRGNGNGRHYWSTVTRDQDLNVQVITRLGEGVCDVSWSADSKRFMAGTIDHSVFVWEDTSYDANLKTGASNAVESKWQIVFRNSMDHTQYVQGVAYDPLGVYLASMGSDRTVRVFSRKTPPKSKKKVLRPANVTTDPIPPLDHQRVVDHFLTDTKLELNNKSKLIKFRRLAETENNDAAGPKPPRSHLYADESTMESFFRRLSWTKDGAYLVTPAALWHGQDSKSAPSFATYLFARHKFDEPCKVLSGLEKPSLVVRPSPILYKLPESGISAGPSDTDCKENEGPLAACRKSLPYRSVFAVLTTDSILVYDTHHTRPLSIIRGLHYASHSDCQWSADGMTLIVSSIDGYISIVSFEKGELGEVYSQAHTPFPRTLESSSPAAESNMLSPKLTAAPRCLEKNAPLIPPCEPGQSAVLEAPPSKRPKKTRIAPTLIAPANTTTVTPPVENSFPVVSAATNYASKRTADILEAETTTVGEAVTKLTLDNEDKPKKKKKRIQPLLVSAGN